MGVVPGQRVAHRLEQPGAGDRADQVAGRRAGQGAAVVAEDGQVEQEPVGRLVRRVERDAVGHARADVEVEREPRAPVRGGDRGPGVEHELQAPQRPGHGQLAQAGDDGLGALRRRGGGADGDDVDVALAGRDPAQRPRPDQVGGHQLVAEQAAQQPGGGPAAVLDLQHGRDPPGPPLPCPHDPGPPADADGVPAHCPRPGRSVTTRRVQSCGSSQPGIREAKGGLLWPRSTATGWPGRCT